MDLLRSLIDRIEVSPGEMRGQANVTLHGALASILDFAASTANAKATANGGSGRVLMVAGTGFEPVTFRLRASSLRSVSTLCFQHVTRKPIELATFSNRILPQSTAADGPSHTSEIPARDLFFSVKRKKLPVIAQITANSPATEPAGDRPHKWGEKSLETPDTQPRRKALGAKKLAVSGVCRADRQAETGVGGWWRCCQTNANQSPFAVPGPGVRQQGALASQRERRRGPVCRCRGLQLALRWKVVVWARIASTRLMRFTVANIGPKLIHQYRTVSWLISIPRSCSRSLTFRSDSGNRM